MIATYKYILKFFWRNVMPLLEPTVEKETHTLRVTIDKALADKIDNYLVCAKIKKVDEFIEKSVEFLFKKDKEFRKYLKEKNLITF